jgi:hypothetical protein
MSGICWQVVDMFIERSVLIVSSSFYVLYSDYNLRLLIFNVKQNALFQSIDNRALSQAVCLSVCL